jgi:hypothetical protein
VQARCIVFVHAVVADVQATAESRSELRVLTNDTIIRDSPIRPLEHWQQELKCALLTPTRKHVTWTTIYIRLQRTYGYLLLAAYLGWSFKLLEYDDFRWVVFVIVTAVLIACTICGYMCRPRITSSAQEYL